LISEGNIAKYVGHYLTSEKNCSVWVHKHSGKSSYNGIESEFLTHTITINGFYPDILAIDPLGYLYAIEVKDEGSIRAGIGQAIAYKKGSNYVFIAGPKSGFSSLKNDILSHGIGVIEVENGLCELSNPPFQTTPMYLKDVMREIEILRIRDKNVGRITSLDLNHPINFIAPILFFDDNYSSIHSIHDELIKWEMKHPLKNIRGAKLLNLIYEKDDKYHLTYDGINLKNILFKLYDDPIRKLNELKNYGALCNKDSNLSYIIRWYYLLNPDVKQFIDILNGLNNRTPLIFNIIDNTIRKAPNLLLNLMIKRKSKDMVLEIFRKYDESSAISIMSDPDFIEKHFLKILFFQFKRQLIHLGILKQSKVWSGSIQSVNFAEDYWMLND